jgi:ATP-dependent exoDNAse (exonuclease V) beta subunit
LLDEDLGLLFNPPDMTSDDKATMFALGQWRDKDRAEAETARLLYVAATRAADKLILSGTMSTSKYGKPTRLGEWLGQLAEPLGLKDVALDWAEDGQAAHPLELDSVLTAPGDTPTLLAYAYEPGWTTAPAPQPATPAAPPAESDSLWTAEGPPLLKPLTPAADTLEAEDLPQRVWQVVPPETSKTAPAWVVGQLVHAALAGWWFPHLETPKFVAWAKSRVAQYGLVSASQTAHAVRQTRQFLRRFQSHPRFTQLNLADERLHEVPYMWQNQGQFEQGYFDTLYRRGEQWTIVDFKTDHLRRPADLAHLRRTSDYWAQMTRYQRAATALLGQRPQAVLCFLDYQGEIYEDIL